MNPGIRNQLVIFSKTPRPPCLLPVEFEEGYWKETQVRERDFPGIIQDRGRGSREPTVEKRGEKEQWSRGWVRFACLARIALASDF